jgi:putative flippase GtrA
MSNLLIWTKKQALLFSKFGVVGIVAALIDVLVFNFLLILFDLGSVESKIYSGILSTLFAWFGNRSWTFRRFRRNRRLVEVIEYFLIAAGGLMISVGCLWFSHHVLGFTSLLADNISGNVVGLILGTAFRFFGNQYWVFGELRKHNNIR